MLYTLLLLTSLLGKIRVGTMEDDDDVSSTVLEDTYDEELLNTDGFNITDDI